VYDSLYGEGFEAIHIYSMQYGVSYHSLLLVLDSVRITKDILVH
jgi:hypothetical protein